MKKYLLLLGVLALAFASAVYAAPFPTGLGGTGTSATPASGTIPIGTGLGSYTPALLTASGTLAILNASGSVTIVGTGATTTIQSVLNSLSAAGLANYNPATGVFTVSSSSLALGTASQHPASDFLASSTAFVSTFNTRSGAITLTSGDVTTALGFTPYNATNPAGYVGGQGNGVAGDCVKWGTSSTLVDALAPCGTGSGGSSSTVVGPFNITGPNGTSTIYGSASSSYIYNLNGIPAMPTPSQLAAGVKCGNSYPDYDAGQCYNDIIAYVGSSTQVNFQNFRYNYDYPINNSNNGQYNLMQGTGQTLLSFSPTYFHISSANSSTKQITYTLGGANIAYNGEPVMAVGASLPSGIAINKIYYIGQLTSSTVVLYTNPTLTTTSTVSGTGTGDLATPQEVWNAGQNPSYGWGSVGISYVGPNNGSSTGIVVGGNQGARSLTLAGGSITQSYYNIVGLDNSYFVTLYNFYSYRNAPNTNTLTYGGLLWMDATSNAGEEWNFVQSVFADAEPANSTLAVDYAVDWQTSGFVDVECSGTSFDDAGFYFNTYDGEGNSEHETNCHHENPGSDGGGWGAIQFFTTPVANPNMSIDVDWSNVTVLNNANGGNTPPAVVSLGTGAMFNGNGVSVQNNNYISATQIPVFATVAAGSYITMTGFHNIGDTPGVQYMYGTRAPTAGIITNAPGFFDSPVQITGNLTYYNGYIGNPITSVVSSTLTGFSPNYQICNGTSTINYTLPTLANNTGFDFDFANRGTANCTLTATSTDLFYQNTATSTALTLTPGQAIRIVDDSGRWTVFANANFNTSNVSTSTANIWSALQTFGAGATVNGTTTLASTTNALLLTNGSGVVSGFSGSNPCSAGSFATGISATGTIACGTPSGVATTTINGVTGPTFTVSINTTTSPSSVTTSSAQLFLNLLQYSSGTDINVGSNGFINFVNTPGFITSAPATTTYSAQGSTITTTALTIATSGPLLSASVSGQTLTITSIPTSTILAGYSTSTATSLAGQYLGVVNGQIVASSTLASSSVAFEFYNATTTAPAYQDIQTPNQKTITNASCWESAAATTTIELYYNTTLASSAIQQVILPSLVCGNAGNTTTTFTTATLPASSYLFAIVSSTAGVPTLTTVNVQATKL